MLRKSISSVAKAIRSISCSFRTPILPPLREGLVPERRRYGAWPILSLCAAGLMKGRLAFFSSTPRSVRIWRPTGTPSIFRKGASNLEITLTDGGVRGERGRAAGPDHAAFFDHDMTIGK